VLDRLQDMIAAQSQIMGALITVLQRHDPEMTENLKAVLEIRAARLDEKGIAQPLLQLAEQLSEKSRPSLSMAKKDES
jgi:hypothetical protein